MIDRSAALSSEMQLLFSVDKWNGGCAWWKREKKAQCY